MTKRFSFLFAALSLLIVLQVQTTYAQQPSAADLEAIQNEIDNLLSKKMEIALKKDKAKADKMKLDLEDAHKQQDNNGKRRSLDNFNRSHKAHYQKTMNEAGINMQDVIAKLRNRFPAYEFSVADDFGVAFSPKETSGNNLTMLIPSEEHWMTPSYTAAKGPNYSMPEEETQLQNYQELMFTGNRSVNCAVASGGSVEIGSRHIKTNSTGVMAGGCTSNGQLVSRTIIPNGRSITGRVTATLEIGCWALGIFGTSVASANSYVTMYCAETNQYFGTVSKNKFVIAPILWYASHSESAGYSSTPLLNNLQGKTLVVSAYGYSSATSIMCCGTNSFARATVTTARFEIVR